LNGAVKIETSKGERETNSNNSFPDSKDETVHTAFLSEREFQLIGRDWQKPIAHIVSNFINAQASS
jgi:hypothetical protein